MDQLRVYYFRTSGLYEFILSEYIFTLFLGQAVHMVLYFQNSYIPVIFESIYNYVFTLSEWMRKTQLLNFVYKMAEKILAILSIICCSLFDELNSSEVMGMLFSKSAKKSLSKSFVVSGS